MLLFFLNECAQTQHLISHLFLFRPCLLIPHLSIWGDPCSLSICLTLHSSHCFLCHLYWTCVRADRRSVFLAYWLLWPSRLFSSLSPLCPCLAELVMEPIDWLAVGPIDPQGRTAGYWRMVPQCLPSLLPSSSSSTLYLSCIFLLLSSLSALLNLSSTSFHLQSPLLPPLSAFICLSIYPFFFPSISSAPIAAIVHRCSIDRCRG